MSASVLSRAYNEPHGLGSGGNTPRTMGATGQEPGVANPASSMKQGDRTRLLGIPGSGLRISFTSDTTFPERKIKSRVSSRSAATSLNLRPVQGGDRPIKSRMRLPKATASSGVRYNSVSHSQEEYFNPRKAMDIARSYGVPKYFLRGNSQILTDSRMRLFGDNVWKKERTNSDAERKESVDSSDVIHRLMDSVDKAIATSEKTSSVEDAGIKLEVVSIKSGNDDRTSLRDSLISLPDVAHPSSSGRSIQEDGQGGDDVSLEIGGEGLAPSVTDTNRSVPDYHSMRPHTVDTLPMVPKQFSRVSFRNDNFVVEEGQEPDQNPGDSSRFSRFPQHTGVRLRQLASPFRGVSEYNMHKHHHASFGDKYQNVLPRFYPAVNAHWNRQIEGERTGSRHNKKKSGQQRLVRFADTHTVRFSNETTQKEPISGLVASRAPVQSVQRSLDSHSGLSQAERLRHKLKEISDYNRAKSVGSLDGRYGTNGNAITTEKKGPYMYQVNASYVEEEN